jgi:hypothetical protein
MLPIRFIAVIAAGIVMSGTAALGRPSVQRDVEGYAIATCLSSQKEPFLKDQGDGWASAIVQRSHGGIEQFTSVAAAVKTELAQSHIPVIHQESDSPHDKELPLLYCAEVIDAPGVDAAIRKAIRKLAPSYRDKKR